MLANVATKVAGPTIMKLLQQYGPQAMQLLQRGRAGLSAARPVLERPGTTTALMGALSGGQAVSSMMRPDGSLGPQTPPAPIEPFMGGSAAPTPPDPYMGGSAVSLPGVPQPMHSAPAPQARDPWAGLRVGEPMNISPPQSQGHDPEGFLKMMLANFAKHGANTGL